MANRRNNKQHPLGVVIPMEDVEEEQSPSVEVAVTTLVDADPDDFFEIFHNYLTIQRISYCCILESSSQTRISMAYY